MVYASVMKELHRKNPRYEVSIYLSFGGKTQGAFRVLDISEDGFQGRGTIEASPGQALEATIHVSPLSGERDVHLHCTVMNIQGSGENSLIGARIDTFGSPEERKSYLEFLGEIAEDLGAL